MKRSDKTTRIQELKNTLIEFRDARDWFQFHDPKNLAEAISIEAGELQEHFLWKDKKTVIKKLKTGKEFRTEVGEELADIFIFALNFANSANMDIASLVMDKIDKSNKKYPVEKSKGNATKYTKL